MSLKEKIFKEITLAGSGAANILIIAILLIIGETRAFILLTACLIISITLTVLIRSFYFKNRPKKQKHNNFLEKIDASSFPSLHSMRVAMYLFIFTSLYGYLAFITFLPLSILVVISRLILRKHDVYDVSFGFIIGLIISYVLVLLY
ncbi:hypothetical protein C0585_02955 [Candidatus Woesearchaeota archaeon]|nr:MAG: hypothetical protein C0585_02955 [Candidatus Woesearchaeota archaeon]